MKKRFFIIIILLIGFSSCKGFLSEDSQDLIRPTTVTHFKEVLQGDAYFKDIYSEGWNIDLMTDNVISVPRTMNGTSVNQVATIGFPSYSWANDVEDEQYNYTDGLFKLLYKNILIANNCINYMDEMLGAQQEKDVLKAQALFTRAYGYFVLANLYSQSYNLSTPNDLCVPLTFTSITGIDKPGRATTAEVWRVISDDIKESVRLFSTDKANRSQYEINYDASLILATRVALYTDELDDVINYGERFLSRNNQLYDITFIEENVYPNNTGGFTDETGEMITDVVCPTFLNHETNREIKFTFGGNSMNPTHWCALIEGSTTVAYVRLGVDTTLLNSYPEGDRRRNSWFTARRGASAVADRPYVMPYKFSKYERFSMNQSLRTAEVYLNLAEAYAKKGVMDRSVDLLNELRRSRITPYENLTVGDFASKEALVAFVFEERRRELCFEEFHRWWDLRRSGQPAITHKWHIDGETTTFKLKEKDPAYILNFPKAELDYNENLQENSRPIRIGVITKP